MEMGDSGRASLPRGARTCAVGRGEQLEEVECWTRLGVRRSPRGATTVGLGMIRSEMLRGRPMRALIFIDLSRSPPEPS